MEINKIKNRYFTYWENYKGIWNYPKKRYVVLFSSWTDVIKSKTRNEFATLEEAEEECKLINQLYSTTPKPVKVYSENGKHKDGVGWRYNYYDWDFSNGAYFWGYALLDMEECKFLRIVNEFHHGACSIKKKPELKIYDYYFRKENEIPKDYEWDERGEYEGWLQFRWGDGKNSINYKENKKERPGVTEIREIYDDATDSFVRRKVRVVYVDWNDPLPKKEKGIIYERPNKEPVIFPGDFGYDNDYSMNEWSLSEEIAAEEYYANNKEKFDNNKVGKSSIADILGDNNPLIKCMYKNNDGTSNVIWFANDTNKE